MDSNNVPRTIFDRKIDFDIEKISYKCDTRNYSLKWTLVMYQANCFCYQLEFDNENFL